MWSNPTVVMLALLSFLFAFLILGCEGPHRRQDVRIPNATGIWKAVEDEDIQEIQKYVKRGGSLKVNAWGRPLTPLRYALAVEKLKSYQELLALGADPKTVCSDGQTVTHLAAANVDPIWLRLALEAGADPNVFNQAKGLSHGTPLGFATRCGEVKSLAENVKLLIKYGANINAPVERGGETALYSASAHLQFESVYTLLEAGADYNAPGPMGNQFIFHFRNMLPEADIPQAPDYKKWVSKIWEWLAKRGVDPRKAVLDGDRWKFD